MNERTLELLWVGAFRYYCGRTTYAVGSFCGALCVLIPELPERARTVIQQELDEYFTRDDSAREHHSTYLPLGHDIDRAEWQKVRDAFRQFHEAHRP